MVVGKCSNEPQNVTAGIFADNDNYYVIGFNKHARIVVYKFNEETLFYKKYESYYLRKPR